MIDTNFRSISAVQQSSRFQRVLRVFKTFASA